METCRSSRSRRLCSPPIAGALKCPPALAALLVLAVALVSVAAAPEMVQMPDEAPLSSPTRAPVAAAEPPRPNYPHWLKLAYFDSSSRIGNARANREKREFCRMHSFLNPKQIRSCVAHFDLFRAVLSAARNTLILCRQAFKNRRFNCDFLDARRGPRQLLYTLSSGTKEAAFLHALSQVMLAQAVWKMCNSAGTASSCQCMNVPLLLEKNQTQLAAERLDWESSGWAGATASPQSPVYHHQGQVLTRQQFEQRFVQSPDNLQHCVENVDFSMTYAETFSTPVLKRALSDSFNYLMIVHNIIAGNEVIKKIKEVRCQCIGATGSCTIRHCFPTHAKIENYVLRLRELYDEAVLVEQRVPYSRPPPALQPPQQQQVQRQQVQSDAEYAYPPSSRASDGGPQRRRVNAHTGLEARPAAAAAGAQWGTRPRTIDGGSASDGNSRAGMWAAPQRRTPQRAYRQPQQPQTRNSYASAASAGFHQRHRRGLSNSPTLVLAPSSRSSSSSGLIEQSPLAHELVYSTPSPDFCEPNAARFVPGTAGRACNKTASAADSCELICCGRGYTTRREQVTDNRCNCVVNLSASSGWGVECVPCIKEQELYNCK